VNALYTITPPLTFEKNWQCIDDCTKCLDICEFLYDNTGPGIKQSRLKAHMRRAEAKKRLGKLADAVADVQEGLENIPDLSATDKGQLTELILKFKADKDADDRVKRLRQLAGVVDDVCASGDMSDTPLDSTASADASTTSTASTAGAQSAAMESEAQTEAASSWPSSAASSSSSSTPPSSSSLKPASKDDVGEGHGTKEVSRLADSVAAAPSAAAASTGTKMRNPANAALYSKSDMSVLTTGQRVASWFDALREEEEEGMIAFDNGDGTYDIVLDDGTEKDAVPRAEIRKLQQPPRSSAAQNAEMSAGEKREDVRVETPSPKARVVEPPQQPAPRAQASRFEEILENDRVGEAQTPAPKVGASVPKSKASSPSVAKGTMRKIMVVEDDSDDDSDAPANPPTATQSAHSAATLAGHTPMDPMAHVFAQAMADGMGDMAGSPPGMSGSAEDRESAQMFAQRMAAMMKDPQIQQSLKNPRVQQIMGELMAGGATAATAPSDDEVLKKYKDDPEVMQFYSKISGALDGVLNTPFPCDAGAAPTTARKATSTNPTTSTNPKRMKGQKQQMDTPVEKRSSDKKARGGGANFAGLAGLDAAAMEKLKGNRDLMHAFKDPAMIAKLHSLLQKGPGTDCEQMIGNDPELAALEDKLMAALGSSAPSQAAAAPAGPGSGEALGSKSGKTKAKMEIAMLTTEEKLKGTLPTVQRLKDAVQTHAAALVAAKVEEDLEEQEQTRSRALSTLLAAAENDVELLQQYVSGDDDVVALLLDQGGVGAVCSLIMALPPAAAAGGNGSAHALLTAALTVLKLVGMNERCMVAVVAHDKMRTVVKLLAWMQGVEKSVLSTVADIAELMEIALQVRNATMCCSVLQCVAACCSVLQCVAVCCGECFLLSQRSPSTWSLRCRCSLRRCVAVCCSMLQCIAVCCRVCRDVLQRVLSTVAKIAERMEFVLQVLVAELYCSMLQCIAVCCRVCRSMLQSVRSTVADIAELIENALQELVATRCNTLQCTATHCTVALNEIVLQVLVVMHCNTLQHPAT